MVSLSGWRSTSQTFSFLTFNVQFFQGFIDYSYEFPCDFIFDEKQLCNNSYVPVSIFKCYVTISFHFALANSQISFQLKNSWRIFAPPFTHTFLELTSLNTSQYGSVSISYFYCRPDWSPEEQFQTFPHRSKHWRFLRFLLCWFIIIVVLCYFCIAHPDRYSFVLVKFRYGAKNDLKKSELNTVILVSTFFYSYFFPVGIYNYRHI